MRWQWFNKSLSHQIPKNCWASDQEKLWGLRSYPRSLRQTRMFFETHINMYQPHSIQRYNLNLTFVWRSDHKIWTPDNLTPVCFGILQYPTHWKALQKRLSLASGHPDGLLRAPCGRSLSAQIYSMWSIQLTFLNGIYSVSLLSTIAFLHCYGIATAWLTLRRFLPSSRAGQYDRRSYKIS